ncbi:hypothetical protein GYMLUDRAFT_244161 [Collybiopsis luxurians FD-317 M1]|uniref:Ricin B lectin domain-containing protein n=1 Tax=Collybiopsis luxurians FD-317 M1 TaxID=944289 RepID=A0A0D0CP35_9AGAR|nr:hypothetical protein GYMLUDRAFT_244161 [Collybiopsis luxurians FD-317 M1]
MAPPSAGDYYIKNIASGYFMTADDKDSFLTPVSTIKPTGDLNNKMSFTLRKGDGEWYCISATYSKANVGAPANPQQGSTAIWTRSEVAFRILDAGEALYNIHLVGENFFLYDDLLSTQPFHTVLFNKGSTADSAKWMFLDV